MVINISTKEDIKMDNAFFNFVQTYYDDIVAFVKALIDFAKALAAKLGGDAEAAE